MHYVFTSPKSVAATCVYRASQKRADVTARERERDDISAISPPTGITICGSEEHERERLEQKQAENKVATNSYRNNTHQEPSPLHFRRHCQNFAPYL